MLTPLIDQKNIFHLQTPPGIRTIRFQKPRTTNQPGYTNSNIPPNKRRRKTKMPLYPNPPPTLIFFFFEAMLGSLLQNDRHPQKNRRETSTRNSSTRTNFPPLWRVSGRISRWSLACIPISPLTVWDSLNGEHALHAPKRNVHREGPLRIVFRKVVHEAKHSIFIRLRI